MKDSHWPVFTNVKTNSRRVKFLTFRSFGNLLTLFCIGIAVSGLMLRLKAKEFSKDPEFKSVPWLVPEMEAPPFCQPSHQNSTHSAARRRFGAANSQVPLICNHIPSASRLFPIKMWFELPSSRTLEFSGNRTVPVKSCGAEKQSLTITLTNGSFRNHHILKS